MAGVLRIRCAALLRSEEIVLARTDLDGHEAVGFRHRLDGRILGERLAALGHLPADEAGIRTLAVELAGISTFHDKPCPSRLQRLAIGP